MSAPPTELKRQFGVWQATALNVTMIVGAGVFATIPYMLRELFGPWALLGWLTAGILILMDGLIWGELGAALPGSGGSYLYLLESYGRNTWGRLMAFLFIWQFLLSGPLELASGLIAMDGFSQSISPTWLSFNRQNSFQISLWEAENVRLTFSPGRLGVVAVGAFLIFLLYRNITTLGRLTFVFWLVVLGIIGWVLVEGWIRFDPKTAFDRPEQMTGERGLITGLGAAMSLTLYSYLGYYNICYVGDEVRDPGKTIPRAVLLSAAIVIVLFVLLHLAMLGVISWRDVPQDDKTLEDFSLPAVFMQRIHGDWAVKLITVCLVGSCFMSVFAGLLGYSRIPYSAARAGHFFSLVGAVHPTLKIPHVSLLLVGGLTLFWSFFDLQNVIQALVITRILEQFVAQIIGLMLLRRVAPNLPRPFRVGLYPLPCLLALGGWLFVYFASRPLFILLGLCTLVLGVVVFFVWSWWTREWPYEKATESLHP